MKVLLKNLKRLFVDVHNNLDLMTSQQWRILPNKLAMKAYCFKKQCYSNLSVIILSKIYEESLQPCSVLELILILFLFYVNNANMPEILNLPENFKQKKQMCFS